MSVQLNIQFAGIVAATAPPLAPRSEWTKDRCDALRKLWPLKWHSAPTIAAEIEKMTGWSPSHQAVSAKAARMGLGPRPKKASMTPEERRIQQGGKRLAAASRAAASSNGPRTYKVRKRVKRTKETTLVEMMVHEEDRALWEFNEAIPKRQRKQLWELTDIMCRFPVGDVGAPNFFFCASPTADLAQKRAYCAVHQGFCSAGIPAPKFQRQITK